MQKLSLGKQVSIVRFYLGGFSYEEIANRSGASKGTVANVVADLRAGRVLDTQEPAEQLQLLRELATDLRRGKLSPGQAVVGLTALSYLQGLGIEPADIEPWAAMCRHLAAEGTEAGTVVRAALAFEEVRERTGLSPEALEEKALKLEVEVTRLESLTQELRPSEQRLEELEKRRRILEKEISDSEKRYGSLSKGVAQQEKREAELFRRIQDLEQRAQTADERLAAARRELQTLAGLGLSPDELAGFVQRLGGVAQRHGIERGALLERLLHELEELEAGLGIEALVEVKRHEVSEAEQAAVKAQAKLVALNAAAERLRQEQAALRAAMTEERDFARKEIQAISQIATEATAQLREDLGNGMGEALLEVQKLRNQALQIGEEIGRYNAIVEANQWLQTLFALLKGDSNISVRDVRAVGLMVLRGVKGWIEQNQSQIPLSLGVTTWLGSTVEEIERWKV